MNKCVHELEPFADRHAGCAKNLFKWRCVKCGTLFKDVEGIIEWGTADLDKLTQPDVSSWSDDE